LREQYRVLREDCKKKRYSICSWNMKTREERLKLRLWLQNYFPKGKLYLLRDQLSISSQENSYSHSSEAIWFNSIIHGRICVNNIKQTTMMERIKLKFRGSTIFWETNAKIKYLGFRRFRSRTACRHSIISSISTKEPMLLNWHYKSHDLSRKKPEKRSFMSKTKSFILSEQ